VIKSDKHHTELTRTTREPSEDCSKFMVLACGFRQKKCFYLEQRFVVSCVFVENENKFSFSVEPTQGKRISSVYLLEEREEREQGDEKMHNLLRDKRTQRRLPGIDLIYETPTNQDCLWKAFKGKEERWERGGEAGRSTSGQFFILICREGVGERSVI
jgi:hypothetical protein